MKQAFIKCWVFIRTYIFLICFVKCSDVMRMNVYCVPYARIRHFLIFYQLYCTQIFTAGNAYICLYLCAVYLYRVTRRIIKSIVFLNTALIYHVRLYCLNIRLQKAWRFVLCDKSRTCDCTVVGISIIDFPRALYVTRKVRSRRAIVQRDWFNGKARLYRRMTRIKDR